MAWDTEEWGTDGTNVTLCLICVWFIVIDMRPESGTATQRIYSPRRTKPWGWDGANCGCHVPWTHTPWVCLAALFRSLPSHRSKGWQSSSTPTPLGFPLFVLKVVSSLIKIRICSPLSTWYLLLLCSNPSQPHLHPHIKPIHATVASADWWLVATLCWLVFQQYLSW